MCGFAGYFNLNNKKFNINPAWLQSMQQSIAHRGPDGFRIWHDNEHELALVHSRLSIVDLSDNAFQPMIDKDKDVVVCVNGEIYNHQELKKELEQLGHHFSSHSDSEVLLHGYKQWGIDELLDKLDGMFAFCLYDFTSQEIFLVRDRIGVKPLYFSLTGNILSFASEIKALWQLPWMHKTISKEAVYHYLTYLATPAPLTMFQGVYKIPPGFYIKIDAQKEMHTKQWYDVAQRLIVHQDSYTEQDYVDSIRTLLRSSIKKRMMSDVPFGVLLSGGIDSSLNVALMSEFTDKVKTFTVAFSDGPEYDEIKWARKVAKTYGTDHHEVIINESDTFNFFQKMVYHQDEPIGDRVCVPSYFVSKLLKESGVSVAQVGEGSDELFCGYQLYVDYLKMHRWWSETQQSIPDAAKRFTFQGAQKLFPHAYGKLDLLNNWSQNKELFYSGAVVFTEYYKKNHLLFSSFDKDPVVQSFFKGMQTDDSYAIVDYYRNQLKANFTSPDMLTQMGYLELKHRIPELLLMRADKMGMAVGVETRVPFLDPVLIEFALSIPMQYKYKNGETKYILKKAAEGILPHDIIYRKKMGFAAPTKRWFKDEGLLSNYFADLLVCKKEDLREIIDLDVISKMYQINKKDASVDYSCHLWAVQNILACI